VSKVDCTVILKRDYAAPLARVWRAWSTADELALWYRPETDHVIHFAECDFRVGGAYRIGFGPSGEAPLIETGRYVEIEPMRRIVFDEEVTRDGAFIHGGRDHVEFVDLGSGRTRVIVTATGHEVWRAGGGWTGALESLAAFLGD
jgi:uncharacterized protein YndB with AHSA1/START domain